MAVDPHGPPTAVMKALAEPMRWRIVALLASEDLCVCHLTEELAAAQPLVSHHLKVLRTAGIVESERDRQWIYYRLRPRVLHELSTLLGGLATRAPVAGAIRRRPCC